MASDSKARLNKNSTVTFTLPISCQICLGKVKQPVLCPNLHVFCHLCLDIWLRRNHQCPACRVEIDDENPIKYIIGGQPEDEFPERQSTPELRRIRFDLLYHEYEDQFEKMRKEIIILKTENSILSAQLNDAEEENKNFKKDSTSKSGAPAKKAPQDIDGANLLALTKNLQEAQKLYSDIKAETGNLKKENSKLKDENASLTQENQNLRLELAQRSPKKFGRFTVATLETKISEQEKEIRQLKMALERSDSYIDELERRMTKEVGNNKDMKTSERFKDSKSHKIDSDHADLWPSSSESKPMSAKGHNADLKENTKRSLFGKSDLNVVTLIEKEIQTGNGPIQKYVDGYDTVAKNILKPAVAHDRMEDSSPLKTERTPKKVHFNVSDVEEKSKEASSFELELPSPLDKSSQLNRGVHLIKGGAFEKSAEAVRESNDGYRTMSDAELKKRIALLLKDRNYHGDLVMTSEADSLKRKSNVRSAESKDSKQASGPQQKDEANDSSHLSIPDPGSFDAHPQSLDFSLTPEMTDCIELMNRAEKNVNLPNSAGPSAVSSYGDTASFVPQIPADYAAPTASIKVSNYQKLSTAPPYSVPRHSSLSTNSDTWQHQFYSSLRSNPYTSTSAVNLSQAAVHPAQKTAHKNVYNMPETSVAGTKVTLSSHLTQSRDFHFSDPVRVAKEFVSLPNSASIGGQYNFRFSEPMSYFTAGLPNPYTPHSITTNAPSNPVSVTSITYSRPSTAMSSTGTKSCDQHFVSSLPPKLQPISSSTPNLTMMGLYSTDRPSRFTLPSSSAYSLADALQWKGNGTLNASSPSGSLSNPSHSSSHLNWLDDSQRHEDTPSSLASNTFKPTDDSLGADFSMSSNSL